MKVTTSLFVIISFFVKAQDAVTHTSCPKPIVQKRTIIHSESSIQSGARLLKKLKVESARDCYAECCNIQSCNVAVMHYKQEFTNDGEEIMTKSCFLFDCGSPSVCTYERHSRYAIIEVPKQNVKSTVETPTTPTMETTPTMATTPMATTPSITTKTTTTTTKKEKTDNKSSSHEKCPPGAPVAMCSSNPCEGKRCAAVQNAICKPSFCGRCSAKFYNTEGHEVNCDGKTDDNVEEIQIAEVDYGETPIDNLPGPPSKKLKSGEDQYFNTDRRDWIDGKNPGDLIIKTNKENKNDKNHDADAIDVIPNEKKIIVVNNSLISIPLLIALIISILLIIGLIYRFKCTRKGKPKKLPVDDGDYLINGMYL